MQASILALLLLLMGTHSYTISQYPLHHVRGIFITNLILQFFANNKTIPFDSLPSYSLVEELKSEGSCGFCHKKFTNSSYLALHYTVKHQSEMFTFYTPDDSVEFQIFFNYRTHNYPTHQLANRCNMWLENLQQRNKTFAQIDSGQFCRVVSERLWDNVIWHDLIRLGGLIVLAVAAVGYLLFRIEVGQKRQRIGRQKSR